MYSTSLWRTEPSLLIPTSNELKMNKPPGGLSGGFTVDNIHCIKYVWQNYTNN